jgi:hypothetical protein
MSVAFRTNQPRSSVAQMREKKWPCPRLNTAIPWVWTTWLYSNSNQRDETDCERHRLTKTIESQNQGRGWGKFNPSRHFAISTIEPQHSKVLSRLLVSSADDQVSRIKRRKFIGYYDRVQYIKDGIWR